MTYRLGGGRSIQLSYQGVTGQFKEIYFRKPENYHKIKNVCRLANEVNTSSELFTEFQIAPIPYRCALICPDIADYLLKSLFHIFKGIKHFLSFQLSF